MHQQKQENSDILLANICTAIKDIKGEDISILDLKKIETAVCKYFVICTGNSNTHVSSISENIKKFVSKEIGEKPWGIEGKNISEWILMDYSDIIIHIFQEKTREFYKIENLWGDAKIKKI